MKASHIYINPHGVPCALVEEMPIEGARFQGLALRATLAGVKASAIPFAEEDREKLILISTSGVTYEETPDTFYPVEPYEFEVEEKKEYSSGVTTIEESFKFAAEHGLMPVIGDSYWAGVTTTKVARIICSSEPNSISGIKPDALARPSIKAIMDRLYEEYPGHKFVLVNENAKGPITSCPNEWTASEPKANPSKELFSIKSLQWRIEEDRITTGTIIGFYNIEEIEDGQFYLSFDRTGYGEVVKGVGQYKSINEAKHQAKTHFESKLKQMLNREI